MKTRWLRRKAFLKSDRYTQSAGIEFAEEGGHLVLMDARGKRFYGVDDVGSRIWALLEVRCTIGDIVDAVSKEYATDGADIEKDVCAFLDRLLGANLVRRVE